MKRKKGSARKRWKRYRFDEECVAEEEKTEKTSRKTGDRRKHNKENERP